MSLARLLQIASPTLPVGAYSYSQGLESAVEAGIVTDGASAERWIGDMLDLSMAKMEAPIVWKLMQGEPLNDLFLASRETAELRAETLQMGHSLCALLKQLDVAAVPGGEVAFPTAYALAVKGLEVDRRQALVAYLWSWLENQVMAAIKTVPLGQAAGQRILLSLGARLEGIAEQAVGQTEFLNFAPGLALLSSQHETQYSRLFRS